jgi:HD-like signal output (HDOD) protein/ActR/RegA family two-component response regulator
MQSGVLFVDDEDLLRAMYETFSHVLQEHYEISTAASGEDGVKLLIDRKFDVVVTDLTMPGMDGLQFLAHVVRTQPDCARIIISGYADRLKVARCLFVGHRYFNKPCDMKSLGTLLLRLASFREIISDQKVRRIIGGLGSLPGPPEMFLKLEKMLESPFSTLDDVAGLVEQDPSVTAKLLQIVNSAQFGLRRKVISAVDAVQLVGLEAVRGLVLGLQAFAGYQNQPNKKAPPAELWEHSLKVALTARRIAQGQGFPQHSCERAFLAGLLHDVGRIVINANAPEEYLEVIESAKRFRIPVAEAELRRFGASHAEIGAYLLALWGIDEEVTLIVQNQEKLSSFKGLDAAALASVHVAHFIESKDPQSYPLDNETLAGMGFIGVENWAEEAVSVVV